MEKLTIRVVGLGHDVTFDVPPSATVGDLKGEVENRTSLLPAYQRLISRGKNLEDDAATLETVGIEHRTRLMLLHSERFAADREGVSRIAALEGEIDELESRSASLSEAEIHELVTQICCKLDGVDTRGSESLRAMRKRAIKRAEDLDRSQS